MAGSDGTAWLADLGWTVCRGPANSGWPSAIGYTPLDTSLLRGPWQDELDWRGDLDAWSKYTTWLDHSWFNQRPGRGRYFDASRVPLSPWNPIYTEFSPIQLPGLVGEGGGAHLAPIVRGARAVSQTWTSPAFRLPERPMQNKKMVGGRGVVVMHHEATKALDETRMQARCKPMQAWRPHSW